MTFAALLLEIRRRTGALSDVGRCSEEIERVAREALADVPDDQERCILAGVLGLCEGDEFDVALLDQMTPELVLVHKVMASELLELGRTNDGRERWPGCSCGLPPTSHLSPPAVNPECQLIRGKPGVRVGARVRRRSQRYRRLHLSSLDLRLF